MNEQTTPHAMQCNTSVAVLPVDRQLPTLLYEFILLHHVAQPHKAARCCTNTSEKTKIYAPRQDRTTLLCQAVEHKETDGLCCSTAVAAAAEPAGSPHMCSCRWCVGWCTRVAHMCSLVPTL